jgi:hypothetical protein
MTESKNEEKGMNDGQEIRNQEFGVKKWMR